MIYIRNIMVTIAKSADYLGNAGLNESRCVMDRRYETALPGSSRFVLTKPVPGSEAED